MIVWIDWDFSIPAIYALLPKYKEPLFWVQMHPQKFTSAPTEGQTLYWSIYDSWWQHQMSVHALRHDMTGQVGGFQNPGVCLQAFPYLSSLPPPRYFYSRHVLHDLSLSFLVLCSKTARISTLATQATRWQEFLAKGKVETGSKKVQSCLLYYLNTCHFVVTKRITLPLILCHYLLDINFIRKYR